MQHWTKLDYPKDEPCPAARKYHAAVCLGQGTQPQLVVFGGEDEDGDTLTDIWILDVESRRWKEVRTEHTFLLQNSSHFQCSIFQDEK